MPDPTVMAHAFAELEYGTVVLYTLARTHPGVLDVIKESAGL